MVGSFRTNSILAAIEQRSIPSVLSYVDVLAKQLSMATTSAGSSFGTLTGARRNPKPFIVGFIVPDNPIDFIPIVQTQNKVAAIAGGTPKSAVAARGGAPPAGGKALVPGLQKRVTTVFSASDLRNALIDAYTQQVGHPPTEATLSLIYAQVAAEIGQTGRSTIYSNNYNLGNVHAGGGTSFYPTDPAHPKGNPDLPPLETPQEPTGGSYFLTTDYKGDGTPYAVYMRAFGGVSDATRGQVATLLGGYPGTIDAQTPEDFNNALINGVGGRRYYEASPSVYLSGLKTGQNSYYKLFGQDPNTVGTGPGPGLTVSGNAPNNTASSDPLDPTGTGRAIMSTGDSTTLEDPLKDPLGRNIQPDASRLAIVQQQINELKDQIDALKTVPPLILLVNPSSFERGYERISDSSSKGRQGQIVHVWTENPMTISCKGVTAAQYAVDAEGSGGLTGANRVFSLSYMNLLSLVMIYKNNGILFTPSDGTAVEKGSEGIATLTASVFIYYDGHVYIGSFNDFSVDDSGDKPYNMDYSFRFNVRYDIEAANVADFFISPLV